MVTLCRRSDGLSRFQLIADGGADAGAEHRRATLLRPQRGTCLPSKHTHTHMSASVLQVTQYSGASTVNLGGLFYNYWTPRWVFVIKNAARE